MPNPDPEKHPQPENPAEVGEPGAHAPPADLPDNNPSHPPTDDAPPR